MSVLLFKCQTFKLYKYFFIICQIAQGRHLLKCLSNILSLYCSTKCLKWTKHCASFLKRVKKHHLKIFKELTEVCLKDGDHFTIQFCRIELKKILEQIRLKSTPLNETADKSDWLNNSQQHTCPRQCYSSIHYYIQQLTARIIF